MIYFISFLFVLVGFILSLPPFNFFKRFIGFVLQAIGTAIFAVLNYNVDDVAFGIIFTILFICDVIFSIFAFKDYKENQQNNLFI